MKTRLILSVAIAASMLSVAPTMAHTPSASTGCADGLPYVTTDLLSYGQGATVSIQVDGRTILFESFTGDFHDTKRLGSGYVAHDVIVDVIATDDPTGANGWTRTFVLRTPPCKERVVIDPRASFIGPCEDPMYAAVLDNRRSDRSVLFRWARIDRGALTIVMRWVGAGKRIRTAFRHVDGRTAMRVTAAGRVIARERSAPGGNYKACPR